MTICTKLTEFLNNNKGITFNVVGGCGIDLSLGKSPCMGSQGVWFKFCPFCGKEIIKKFDEWGTKQWDWREE